MKHGSVIASRKAVAGLAHLYIGFAGVVRAVLGLAD
jgi:hypothetical protein